MALCQGRRLLQRSWNRQLLSEFIPAFRYEEMHTRSIFKLSERIQESMEGQYGTLLTRLVGCDPQTRWFRSSQLLMDNINVEIQSMGESISEGTIAEVLKSEGDSVGEDETIAQIETDKVTIDVKAPSAGTLTELRIKVDDTVKTGQIVAVISGGAAGDSETKKAGGAEPSSSQNNDKHTKENHDGSDPSHAEEEGHDKAEGRRASIKFPERMTGGIRISQMSDEERSKMGGSAPQPSKQEVPAAAKAAKEPQPKKAIWYVGTEQGTKLSQSQVLSLREMEQIELGGAEP